MKLTDLTIEGLNSGERLQINRMHQGLNVILDASDLDREAVAKLIRYTLFGEPSAYPNASGHRPQWFQAGHADVARGPYRFRLTRKPESHHALQVQGLDNASQIYSGDQMFGKVDLSVFDALYDVDFNHLGRQLSEAAVALSQRLGIKSTNGRWANEAQWLAWKSEAEALKQRLATCRTELASLELERNQIQQQLAALTEQEQSRRQQFERELSEIDARISETQNQLAAPRRELDALEAQIVGLQAEIDRREQEVQFQPVEQSYDGLEVLYGQLDLVDVQLARWRQLQTQVQQQRIELRDEMERWEKSLLDSAEHPYHVAQQALERTNSLTTKIEQAAAKIDVETPAEKSGIRQANSEVRKSCEGIRKDLNLVCDELANQYRQLRHKAAAATMKHLREHYNAIAENITWLLQEREQTIQEIRAVDSVGADAIVEARQEFCELASRDGFLAARRKFHGQQPLTSGDHRAIYPDLTATKNQLQQWRLRQSEMLQTAARLEAELQKLNERRAEANARKDPWSQTELSGLRDRLANLQTSLAGKQLEIEQLVRIVAENDAVPPYVGNALLNQASQYAGRLTENQITSVALADSGANLLVTDRLGKTREVASCEPNVQQATLLAVCLAANWWLTQQGITVPMMLRDVLPTSDLQLTATCAAVLREFGLAGHQLLVFTRDRQVAELVAQRLISGTFSFFRTGRPSTNVGTIPTITRGELNYFASSTPSTVAPAPVALSSDQPAALELNASSTQQPAESSWHGQRAQAGSRPLPRPVVYSDRSDFRSFPAYRPPVGNGRPHLEVERSDDQTSGIAATIRPLVERANLPMNEATSLRNVDLADAIHLSNLSQAGVATVGDLLKLDPQDLAPQLARVGFTASQLDRWQSQAWLMLCVDGLTPSDARVLIGCGITEPEQLETTSAEQLVTRIQRYLQSPDGRRFAADTGRYQLERIQSWHRALELSRNRWRIGNGYSRRLRRQGWTAATETEAGDDAEEAGYSGPSETGFLEHERSPESSPRGKYFEQHPEAIRPEDFEFELEMGEDRKDTRKAIREALTGAAAEDSLTRRELRSVTPSAVSPPTKATSTEPAPPAGLKFYLNLKDAVEAAPSIGPRTAERFVAIGVNSIDDFLRMTAESMAEKIDFKRLSADVIRQWQQQARLVCQIPNLRGHDAQLLVAVGVSDAEQLAASTPKKLWSLIGPYADTKEGLKIIRAGKKPDLQEVTDWIQWAKQTRSLQAA